MSHFIVSDPYCTWHYTSSQLTPDLVCLQSLRPLSWCHEHGLVLTDRVQRCYAEMFLDPFSSARSGSTTSMKCMEDRTEYWSTPHFIQRVLRLGHSWLVQWESLPCTPCHTHSLLLWRGCQAHVILECWRHLTSLTYKLWDGLLWCKDCICIWCLHMLWYRLSVWPEADWSTEE